MTLNFAVQYKVHFYVSALTNMQKPSPIFIDRVAYIDNDPPHGKEAEALQTLKDEGRLGEFTLDGIDLLEAGNKDEDDWGVDALRRSYNDQLLRYNNQYSRLVGNFHTNADLVLKIIQGLPEQRFLMELQSKIYTFTGLQN